MIGRCLRRVALALAIVGVASLAAPAAHAASSDWWYDGFGVPEVQAQGWTGQGVKVAVIDAVINPDLPVFQGTNLTVDKQPLCKGGTVTTTAPDPTNDEAHGSDATALLIGNGKGSGHVRGIAPKADVTFYGFGFPLNTEAGQRCVKGPIGETSIVSDGIQRAVDDGARVISISIGDGVDLPGDPEVIAHALAKGVVIVAAVPNTKNDENAWPWQRNGVVAVNAFGQDGRLQDDQEVAGRKDVWPGTTVVAPGVGFESVIWKKHDYLISGSSLATPLTAGIVAVAAQKYPQATGNQLIQSLIHNTTPNDHELTYVEDFGYGPVSLRHVLAVDPAKYPDVNPLMDKASDSPTADQVAAAGAKPTVSPAPSASRSAAADPATRGTTGPPGALITVGVVVLAVIVIGVIVLIVVAAARRKKNAGGAV